jgi:cell wall-associated NlpC family hydrolase
VKNYIGIPFAEHGRDRGGCDCWGLVRLVQAERFGRRLPDLSQGYASSRDAANIASLYEMERLRWEALAAEASPEAGDVIVLRIAGAVRHVGLVAAPGTMLHILKNINSCLERYDRPLWKNRIEAVYRRR